MNVSRKQFGRATLHQMILVLGVAALLFAGRVVRGVPAGELLDAQPDGSMAAGVTPKDNAKLPLDAMVVDEHGTEMKLSEFFDGKKPVIFMLVYYSCPNLCTQELNNLVKSLKDKDMTLKLGEQFSIVTLSFSDSDTPATAQVKKDLYVKALGTDHEHSWHFLTGKPDQVRRIADSVGFGYVRNYTTGDYMHGSAIFICTPDGSVSRTIQDVEYPAPELRDTLIYASQGKIASPIFRFAKTCGIIEYNSGRYTWAAMGLIRAAGILTMVFIVAVIGAIWLRSHRRAGTIAPNIHIKPV